MKRRFLTHLAASVNLAARSDANDCAFCARPLHGALRCPCPIGSHLPDSGAYQGPAGRPAVLFLVRNV